MNSKKKKSGCITSSRKKKPKNSNGNLISSQTVTKPLEAWLERVRLVLILTTSYKLI